MGMRAYIYIYIYIYVCVYASLATELINWRHKWERGGPRSREERRPALNLANLFLPIFLITSRAPEREGHGRAPDWGTAVLPTDKTQKWMDAWKDSNAW